MRVGYFAIRSGVMTPLIKKTWRPLLSVLAAPATSLTALRLGTIWVGLAASGWRPTVPTTSLRAELAWMAVEVRMLGALHLGLRVPRGCFRSLPGMVDVRTLVNNAFE